MAEKLGGASTLAETGAFAEVEPLAEGGLRLLATADFKDYGMRSAEAVFHAVAPALPPGMPRARKNYGDPPTFVVIEQQGVRRCARRASASTRSTPTWR